MREIIIPAALQINMDDIGWWCGKNELDIGGSSRTAMPRYHCPADYEAIHQLGKALNMEITCALVIGEWDMENRLSKEVKYFSRYGDDWNNAAYRNPDEMREAVGIMNNSPYIGIALHGLYHGYYMPGVDHPDVSDWYYRKDNMLYMVPEDEIRNRLNHYYRLCEYHKMTSEISLFIPPSNAYQPFNLSAILKDYGIKYMCPFLNPIQKRFPDIDITDAFVENGIITINRGQDKFEWDEVGSDFNALDPCFGIFGMHWINMLNIDPAKHGETLKRILPYFRRCADTYGIVMSRNMAFACTQQLTKKYAAIDWIGDTCVIDLTNVPEATGKLDTFFISSKTPPKSFENCTLGEIQEKSGFINYEIKPSGKIVKIHF